MRNENVTPKGSPALVKPMNNGIEEQEQKRCHRPQKCSDDVCSDPVKPPQNSAASPGGK